MSDASYFDGADAEEYLSRDDIYPTQQQIRDAESLYIKHFATPSEQIVRMAVTEIAINMLKGDPS